MYKLSFIYHDFSEIEKTWENKEYEMALEYAQWADKSPFCGATNFVYVDENGVEEYREIWPTYGKIVGDLDNE